jgi:hypothetical protein
LNPSEIAALGCVAMGLLQNMKKIPALVLLLCGGDKKTRENDIERAKKYWLDYKRRKNDA